MTERHRTTERSAPACATRARVVDRPDSTRCRPAARCSSVDDDSATRTATAEYARDPRRPASRPPRRRPPHRAPARGRCSCCSPLLIVVGRGRARRAARSSTTSRLPDYSGAGRGVGGRSRSRAVTAPATSATCCRRPVWSKSTKAFTDAAADNSEVASIQPGSYNLHSTCPAAAALHAAARPESARIPRPMSWSRGRDHLRRGAATGDRSCGVAPRRGPTSKALTNAGRPRHPGRPTRSGQAADRRPRASSTRRPTPSTQLHEPDRRAAARWCRVSSSRTATRTSPRGAKTTRPHAVPGADHRVDRAGRGQVPDRHAEGRARHPQPHRASQAAADRRHQRLRGASCRDSIRRRSSTARSTARTTPTRTRACRRRPSTIPARTP